MARDMRLQRHKGIALLAALIFMLAIVLTMGNIFYSHQLDVSRLSKNLHGDQALLLALSAENWARQLLSAEQDDPEVDNLQENWAIAVPVLPIEGGFLRGCLQDLQGRVNLSSFGVYDSERLNAEMQNEANGLARMWLSLLRMHELSFNEASVATIIDWVDVDDTRISEWGAEQQSYDANRTLVMVANSVLTDIEELAVMRGYGPNSLALLRPWLSALPRPTTININTAPQQILQAMGGTLPQAFSDYVLSERPFYSLESFHEGLAAAMDMEIQEVETMWPDNLVGINSDYFSLQLQVSLGESQLQIESILGRFDRNEPAVISRTVTVVPAMAGRLDGSENLNRAQTGICEHLESS
ncbi:MAG: hypothetical protein CMP91_03035 [Gammaproteobacteria bacterium]|nr:hypothetical protein [Gammaproteobacteria bacterium]MAY02366.1 hypothetical protein [Gammaproteobacteria bacterium]